MKLTGTGATAAAVLAGALQLVAHPGFDLPLLAWLAPAALATAVTLAPQRAGRLGVVTALVLYVPMLHWLRFRATILAWLLLVVVMAAWTALLAHGMARLLRSRWGLFVVPLWWVGIDAWRSAIPWGGFGWASLGITQVGNGWLAPLGRVLGEKGLTLAVVTLSLAAWAAVRNGLVAARGTDDAEPGRPGLLPGPQRQRAQAGHDASMPAAIGLVVVALGITLVTVGPPPAAATIEAMAVQPNDIEHPESFDGPLLQTVADNAVDLTEQSLAADGPADLVVWPEGSIGIDPTRDPVLADALIRGGVATDGRLVAGTDLEDDASDNFRRVSVQVDETGAITDHYVKRQLVPFGEFVPLRWMFDWYPPLAQVPRDAIPGTEAHQLTVPTRDAGPLTVAVAICFETMYPGTVAANVRGEDGTAGILVSSTSSSTFGRSAQPHQHLAQSRMRAIETGRWVVHATSSGTTALVDNRGAVRTTPTDLYTRAVVRGEVDVVDGLTPFLVIGDVLDPAGRATVAIVLAALVAGAVRRTRTRADDPRERDDA